MRISSIQNYYRTNYTNQIKSSKQPAAAENMQTKPADLGPKWAEGERPMSKIVFIGRNLPESAIITGLETCLVDAP